MVDKEQLILYYKSFNGKKELEWKNILGDDINWNLSFDACKEAETTKHVHRLTLLRKKYIFIKAILFWIHFVEAAQQKYIDEISAVLINCKKFLSENYEVFIVANDKYNLYEKIAETAGMTIIEQFKRPVLNRTEKDKNAYSEIIFRMKERTV